MENSELLLVQIMMGFSTLFPAFLMKLIHPDKINHVVGYRTKRSMKSQATWDFAQEYCGNVMMWSALVAITIEIFSFLVFDGETGIMISVGALLLSVIISIVIVERELKRRFDHEGNPKNGLGRQN